MWTMNFQMFKLVLEKTEEPEIKLPTSAGLWKKQESSRKTSALLTMPKPLIVWITANCGKFFKPGFSNTWTVNSLMFKLVLEKAEEPEIQLPTSAGSWKKHLFLLIDYAKAFECVDHSKLWKILKEMGIPDHLTCLLRNLYAGQEATVRTGHGTTDWFHIGKGAHQGCTFSPCLFNLYAEYIIRNAGLDEAKLGSRLPGEYQ